MCKSPAHAHGECGIHLVLKAEVKVSEQNFHPQTNRTFQLEMSLDASSETEKPQNVPLTREDIPELVKAVAEALKNRSTPSQGTSCNADDGPPSKTGTSAGTGELAKHHI